jgi:toxin FitB
MIVLDTNVLSELMLPSPAEAVHRWLSQQAPDQMFTTTVSMAEILQGIELLPVGKKRATLSTAAHKMFALFPGRILPFHEEAARAFAPIAVLRRRHGRPISLFDAQIASIAKAYGATLATRDVTDFKECGIAIVNPWET